MVHIILWHNIELSSTELTIVHRVITSLEIIHRHKALFNDSDILKAYEKGKTHNNIKSFKFLKVPVYLYW